MRIKERAGADAASWANPSFMLSELTDVSGQPLYFRDGEIRVRYISLNDSSKDKRLEWLDYLFPNAEKYIYSESDTSFLTSGSGDYDAILVGGKDVARMSKIIRENLPILKRKLRICVTSESNSRRRAQLIMAGFDDVVDVERVAYDEAAARFRAMWRRYLEWFEREARENFEIKSLAGIVDPSSLNSRERTLLMHLKKSPGQTVSYISLRVAISIGWETVSNEHLKVIISNIRKKLKPGVRIVADPNIGYRIEISNGR